MRTRILLGLLALAVCASCSDARPNAPRTTDDDPLGGRDAGADGGGPAHPPPRADGGQPESDGGRPPGHDAGTGADGSMPDGGLRGGGDGGSEGDAGGEQASDTFFTSFEADELQPTWSNTTELAPDGTARTSGVSGEAKRISGSIMALVSSVSASGENPPNEAAPQVADGEPTTKWLTFTSTGWVRIDLARPEVVTRYALTSANDAPDRDPRDFRLEGSEDGATWVTLDARTGVSFADRFVTNTYEFVNATAYRSYRLNITSNHAGGLTQLAELQLSSGDDGASEQVPMRSEVGGGPGASWNAKLGAGFTGLRSLRYGGRVVSEGPGHAYNQVFEVDLRVSEETELSYVIFPNPVPGDASYASTFAAIDLAFEDGSYLSELGALDDSFGALNPRGQGLSRTLIAGEWNHKACDLGAVAAGKTIRRILVGYDHPAGPVAFGGFIDDLRIGPRASTTRAHPSDYVETRRGSFSSGGYSRGNTFPATAVPHGFNFWTPVTDAGSLGWLYSYHRDNDARNLPRLSAFSLSHQPSPWMGDRQTFQVMPSSASSLPSASRDARALAFRHANEIARAHYYSVVFESGIRVEITPTDHAAMFRFTFPGDDASLIFDNVENAAGLTLEPGMNALSAYSDVRSYLSAGATRMFIYATFDAPVIDSGTLRSDSGAPAGYLRFRPGPKRAVTMRIATSLLGRTQAQKNLALEIGASDTFESVMARAQSQWDEKLGLVEVEGANLDQLTTFYSNLYRLFLYPNSAFENVGTAQAPSYAYASPVAPAVGTNTPTTTGAKVSSGKLYVNNGFWDTYRSAWPLLTLLTPTHTGELIDGFVQQYKDGGWISRWSSPGHADLMTGTSSEVAFADAYLKGVRNFDAAAAFAAGVRSATVVAPSSAVGRKGNDTSIFLGYTPYSENLNDAMSWAMAGYLNDFGLANLADALAADPTNPRQKEYAESAVYFRERSRNYVHMFDPAVAFFQGRTAGGTFRFAPVEFDPRVWGRDFTETNAWNMAFDAPHDGQGLANLYGGRAGLAAKLDAFFATPERAAFPGGYGGTIHEMIEARDVRMGQLGLSNQPAYHIPYMYLYAGQPHKTQEKVRDALRRLWVGSAIGQGFLGDEDNGALASWQIFSALGFYPLQVGSPYYVFGSPLFKKAVIHLENGGELVVNAPNNGPYNFYVQGLRINGTPYTKTHVPHAVLAAGATLDFDMGPEPSSWGTGEGDQPPSVTSDSEAPGPLEDVTSAGDVSEEGGVDVGALTDDTSATRVTFVAANPTIRVHFPDAAREVTFYTLTSSATSGDPAAWTLYGSQNGTSWVRLDQRSGQTFPWRAQTRAFAVERPGAYAHYRLALVAGAATSLAELELLATP